MDLETAKQEVIRLVTETNSESQYMQEIFRAFRIDPTEENINNLFGSCIEYQKRKTELAAAKKQVKDLS